MSIGFYNCLQVSIYFFFLTKNSLQKKLRLETSKPRIDPKLGKFPQVGVFERREGAADSLYGAFFDAAPNLQGMFRVRGGAAMGDREMWNHWVEITGGISCENNMWVLRFC